LISSGVYYNDSTKAVLGADGDTFEYIARRKVEVSGGQSSKNNPVSEKLSLSNFPEGLTKKVTLLKHFRNYLIEQQSKCDDIESNVVTKNEILYPTTMTYVKKWLRTKHAILFRLSNQTVQIIFYDQTEVLLTPDIRYVTYVDKKRVRSTFLLSDDLVGTNTEMAKRLTYSRDILNQLLSGRKEG
jgi:polo-like kinase 1